MTEKYLAGSCRTEDQLSEICSLVHENDINLFVNLESLYNILSMEPEKQDDSDWDASSKQEEKEQVRSVFLKEKVSLQELKQMVHELQAFRSGDISANFFFDSELDMKYFQNQYDLQEHDEKQQDNLENTLKEKKAKTYVEPIFQKQTTKTTISLQPFNKRKVFMIAYKDKIEKLEKKQECKIWETCQNLTIESMGEIGPILKNQIMALYKGIKVYQSYDKNLWEKFFYSKQLGKRLNNRQIFLFQRLNRKALIFYSTSTEYKGAQSIRSTVEQETSHDLKIFDLKNRIEFSKAKDQVLFHLLKKALSSTIREIKDLYETNVEINLQQKSYIFHIQHESFAEAPLSLLRNKLSKLWLLSFYIPSIHSEQKRLKKLSLKGVYYGSIKKRLFLCVDESQIKSKATLKLLLSGFFQQMSQKSTFQIFSFMHQKFQVFEKQKKQIIQIGSQLKVDMEKLNEFENGETSIAEIKLKQISTKLKGRAEASFANFFKHLFNVQPSSPDFKSGDFTDKKFQEKRNEQRGQRRGRRDRRQQKNQLRSQTKQNSEAPEEEKQEQSEQEQRWSDISEKKGEEQEKKDYSEEKKQVIIPLGSELQASFPQIKSIETEELFKIQQSTKNRDKKVEKQINNQYSKSCKVWKLQLNKQLSEKASEIKAQKAYLTNDVDENNKLIEFPQLIPFSAMEQNEKYFLIYFNSERTAYIPTHLIKCLAEREQ